MSDLGMTGPHDSVIGMRTEVAVTRFVSQMPQGFRAAKKNPWLQGAVLKLSEETGKAINIQRINLKGRDI